MPEDGAGAPGGPPRLGRIYLVYGLYRLVLFLLVTVVLGLAGLRGLPLLLTGLLTSAILSVFVLRPQRDAVVRATAERDRWRRDEQARRRARLDGTP